MNDKFEIILESLINGQREQMVEQMDELDGYEKADLFAYVSEFSESEKLLDMIQSYFRMKT